MFVSDFSMVSRFSMESQDKRMCKIESVSCVTEPVSCGATIDCNTHRVCDEDCFGDILYMLDFPMESLEGDGFAEDWASKLGPIPSEVFKEIIPPPGSQVGGGSYSDLPFDYPVPNNKTSQQKYHLNRDEEANQSVKISQLKQQTSVEDRKPYLPQVAFEAPSPNSVLESRTSSSNNKGIVFSTKASVPVRSRSKRFRPTTNPWLLPAFELNCFKPIINPWLLSTFEQLPNPGKRTKTTYPIPETRTPLDAAGIKKCAHCEITKTPQWREGPMGPKTLCNACGVRYRSGRLYPEYRPAASPTFVPALHSNCHRKVIEMRQKDV